MKRCHLSSRDSGGRVMSAQIRKQQRRQQQQQQQLRQREQEQQQEAKRHNNLTAAAPLVVMSNGSDGSVSLIKYRWRRSDSHHQYYDSDLQHDDVEESDLSQQEKKLAFNEVKTYRDDDGELSRDERHAASAAVEEQQEGGDAMVALAAGGSERSSDCHHGSQAASSSSLCDGSNHRSRSNSSKKSRGRINSRSRYQVAPYQLIFALALLLCTPFLQSSLIVGIDAAAAADGREMNKRNGIQRKRASTTATTNTLLHQNNINIQNSNSNSNNSKRIINHRRAQSQMCTCSPLIFNIQIHLDTPPSGGNPCSIDDLDSNKGIVNSLCLYDVRTGSGGGGGGSVGSAQPVSSSIPPPPMGTYAPVASPASSTEPPVDPFRPPQPTTGGGGGGGGGGSTGFEKGMPTYSPTTGFQFEKGMPTYSPTSFNREYQERGFDDHRGGEESTYYPTTPFPSFSPTTHPTPYSDDDDVDGGGVKQRNGGGGGGGWLNDDSTQVQEEESNKQMRSISVDDDEVISPHHHRHHHHTFHEGGSGSGAASYPTPTDTTYYPTYFVGDEDDEDGGGRRLTDGKKGRKRMQVINVDQLQRQGDGDKSDEAAGDEDKSEGKEMKPPYYQPPVTVHEEALGEWLSIHPNDAFFQRHPELKQFQEEIYRLKHNMPSPGSKSSSSSSSNSNTRSLQQGAPLIPVDLISAQFLEMDTSPNMQIINQDDQYLNVSFPDPSNIVLQYSSISNLLDPASALSSQMEYVPGGAILVLVGVTASGEVVRNRLMWTYTMGCGMEDYTILDGDMIGWAGFENLTPARQEFCPASGNLPPPPTPAPTMNTPAPTRMPPMPTTKPPIATPRPTTKTPTMDMPSTMPPTKKPSSKPPSTKRPSMSMGSGDIFDHFDLSGKSKKKKKRRGGGVNERYLEKTKEDFRTLRRREDAMEFGRPL